MYPQTKESTIEDASTNGGGGPAAGLGWINVWLWRHQPEESSMMQIVVPNCLRSVTSMVALCATTVEEQQVVRNTSARMRAMVGSRCFGFSLGKDFEAIQQ